MTAPPLASPSPRPAPIDCETAVRRLWDFLDDRLPPCAHAEVEEHLATCALCPPHFRFAQSIRDALAASANDAEARGSGTDEAQLRERVRRALRAGHVRDDDHEAARDQELH